MKVIVKKWSNSAAVRILAPDMGAAHIALEQSVEVREEQKPTVIEPVRRKTYILDEMLGGITPMNRHQHIDTVALVGKEV
jgi:antitoxin MazE